MNDDTKSTAAFWGCLGTVLAAIVTGIVALIVAGKFPLFSTSQAQVPTLMPTPLQSCVVPDLERKDQAVAEVALTQLGLQIEKVSQFNAETPLGEVLSQDPIAGTKLSPCQGKVTVVVSLGAIPTSLPATPTSAPPTLVPTQTPVPEPRLFLDFENNNAEQWSILTGGTAKAFDGKYIVVGDPILVTVTGSETWQNYSLRVKAKIVSGYGDFGIIVRATKKGCHLYQMQFYDNRVFIYRYDGDNCGKDGYGGSNLANNSYRLDRDTWNDIRLDVQGTKLTGYVNGVEVISAEDAVYLSGMIGLRAQGGTQVFFDDIEVIPLP